MTTDDLIAALAADPQPAPRALRPERSLPLRLGLGVLGLLALYALAYGPRTGLVPALAQPLVAAKTLLPLLLAGLALVLALRAARPGRAAGRAGWLIWLLPAVAAALFLGALRDTPPDLRLLAIRGHSIPVCLPSIPLLSLPVLAGLMLALRRGAPVHPARAGALAGLAAAGLATAVYSTYCSEDTPLFYAVWYSAGILITGAIGALAGARWLRW